MDLCNPRVIRILMEEAGIRFRRDYGQNFLIDSSVPENIAEASAAGGASVVLEIGPGVGCLTRELADRFERVLAVEIDRGLIGVLARTLADKPNVTVISGDIMKMNLTELFAEQGIDPAKTPVSVAANLPYYITTPILMTLLESGIPFRDITVMVQKEVADRLVAKAGTSDYGAITAVLGYWGKAEKLFGVPHSAFLPAPKVDSAVVRITLYPKPIYEIPDTAFFFTLIHGAFEMRRKTLQNALTAKCPFLSKEDVADALRTMGLPADIRGERLSTADFARLTQLLYPKKQKNG